MKKLIFALILTVAILAILMSCKKDTGSLNTTYRVYFRVLEMDGTNIVSTSNVVSVTVTN